MIRSMIHCLVTFAVAQAFGQEPTVFPNRLIEPIQVESELVESPATGILDETASETERPFLFPVDLNFSHEDGDSLRRLRLGTILRVPLFIRKDGDDLATLVAINLRGGTEFLDADFSLVNAEPFDATAPFEVPSTLFSAGGGLTVIHRLTRRWRTIGNLNLAYQSDGESNRDALRGIGVALLVWERNKQFTWSFGAAFLGQESVPVVPAIGLDWRPTPDLTASLGFPMTRLSLRLPTKRKEFVARTYASFGFDGASYAVARPGIGDDVLTLRSLPLSVGVEAERWGKFWFVEAGYLFARRVEYEQADQSIDLSDGFRVQLGVRGKR